jgi:tripartite-type tricarboxylate transporter receptor subunit TctC
MDLSSFNAIFLALGTALSAAPAIAADSYPSRPIRLIVPAAAGGSTDIGARLVAKLMGQALGQAMVVDNRGGGGGRIGAAEAAHATPDGYTLIYANSITHALLPATSKSLQYNVMRDFAPVAGMFWYSTLIVCNTKAPFNDVKGMIEYARKAPGKLTIATAGQGSGNHFSSQLLASMAGIEVTHIPYKGNQPATQEVIGGQTDCIHIGEAKPYLDSGRLKALATTGRLRDPRFPGIPTVDESGLKGYDITWWQGVFAPAGTPKEIVEKLTAAARRAIEDPSVRPIMFDAGFVPQFVPPAELSRRMQGDMTKFSKIATDAKLELD